MTQSRLRSWCAALLDWLTAPAAEPDTIDLTDVTRKQAIAEAEYRQRADAMSKIGRVSQQPVHAVANANGVAPGQREGRLVRFVRAGLTMSRPDYAVLAVRGNLPIGAIRFRNQWNAYAFYPPTDGVATPLNMEMLAEIYAMLRELRGSV